MKLMEIRGVEGRVAYEEPPAFNFVAHDRWKVVVVTPWIQSRINCGDIEARDYAVPEQKSAPKPKEPGAPTPSPAKKK